MDQIKYMAGIVIVIIVLRLSHVNDVSLLGGMLVASTLSILNAIENNKNKSK